MAAQTGRTVSKWEEVYIDDSGDSLRQLVGVKTISGIGLAYDEMDKTALLDAVKNALPGFPDITITLTGEMDTTATVGFHTVMSALNGGNTPLSFDFRVGMRHAWESGEPQFGITSTSTSGMIVTSYTGPDDNMIMTATLKVMGGTAPAWGTAAET